MNPVFGYGVSLVRKAESGRVFVEACVPGSPADQEGIKPGAELLEYDGAVLWTFELARFKALMEKSTPQSVGRHTRWHILQENEERWVILYSAEIVWPPEQPALAKGDPALEQLIHRGVEGVEYADGSVGFELTGSLSDAAVDNILARQ